MVHQGKIGALEGDASIGVAQVTGSGTATDRSRIEPGGWFGTVFIFPYIGNNHPN